MKLLCAVVAIGLGVMGSMDLAYSQPYSGPGSGSGYGRDVGPGSGTGTGRDYVGPGSGTGQGRCRTIIQRTWRNGERVVVRRRVCS
jgi:hypothetical protein